MTAPALLDLDAVIFGGGASGLWLLDELRRRGSRAMLLETNSLGAGQTILSQGIIHGGAKYAFGGSRLASARAIRAMPTVWRRSLAGEREPDLRGTRRRAEFCHLWTTKSLASRLVLAGAKMTLHVRPSIIDHAERPPVLAHVPGAVARLDEQVIEPESFLRDLAARNEEHLLLVDPAGVEFDLRAPGCASLVRLIDPASGAPLDLRPARIILAAGAGNELLRERLGLPGRAMQRRPLHMVVARGDLPPLNGHCIDGTTPIATITSTRDYTSRSVWQIGGRIAEEGVSMEPKALVRSARRDLERVLPGLDLDGAEWTTYRVDRAEGVNRSGARPAGERVVVEGNTITGWPTKLALVPRLVESIIERLPAPAAPRRDASPSIIGTVQTIIQSWPRPNVASPPWDLEEQRWWRDTSAAAV